MSRLQKAMRLLKDDKAAFIKKIATYWGYSVLSHPVPDKLYLQLQYKARMGKKLNLKNPQTMNEKLQWLKLHNRKPEYTTLVDKYRVRDYIAEKLGEEYLIPLLGAWDRVEVIDFDALPDQFVLKCNHDSTSVTICRDKAAFDVEAAKEKLNSCLKKNAFWPGREWPYKNVQKKIICEKFMTDSPDSDDFTDYKFYCFNGRADCVVVSFDRASGDPKFYFFNKNWQLLRYNKRGKAAPEGFTLPKPEGIEKMFEIAEMLSQDVGAPLLRVDLYYAYGQIYFGELTFFPDSGFDANRLPETDRHFGEMIKLDNQEG